jgi:hypothetical protein
MYEGCMLVCSSGVEFPRHALERTWLVITMSFSFTNGILDVLSPPCPRDGGGIGFSIREVNK